MELTKSFHSSRQRVKNYFFKENIAKISNRRIHPSKLSPQHKKLDSNCTTVDNPKISSALNTEILSYRMKPYNYKRAESELRQILGKSSTLREKSEESQKTSISRISNGFIQPVTRNYSTLKSKEADLIINEYKSIKNPKVWESFLDNLRANPKHLLDLIPISLTTKNSKTSRGRLTHSKLAKTSRVLKKTKNQETSSPVKPRQSYEQTPELIESLKINAENLTEDWVKSLLCHNIKHNDSKIEIAPGYTKEELENVLVKMPSTHEDLKEVLERLNFTVEKLLVELLGTQDDLDKFGEVYDEATPSVIRTFTVKCLDLYRFREKTIEIIKEVMKRETILRDIMPGDRKEVIEMHKESKKIRELISAWLADESVPFTKFIYKGEDYIEKMGKDLVLLQTLLTCYKS